MSLHGSIRTATVSTISRRRAEHSWIRNIAVMLVLAGSPLARPDGKAARRLFVEPFATNAGAEKLQSDVTADLRKLDSLSLVSSASKADLVLGGGGEIWVKGYRSLNPRSGRLPSDGTPIYGGYLSVELKDQKGVTVWSYLVTPSGPSEDLPQELSRQIVKHLAEFLEHGDPPSTTSSLPQPATILRGAGATFPYPVYSKWFTNYRTQNPAVEMTYDAVGSEEGVRRLLAGTLDFAASDNPQAIHEIAPAGENKYRLLPSVVGAVVPIVNLPGVAGNIAFTPEALAGIFLGKIKKWNDPVLKRANRGVALPELDIVVVHRSDGSGTSYAFTDYLSKTSPEWKAQVGAGLDPKWPAGRAAAGNDGVAKLVKELGGSIGYVEFIYALQNHLSYGSVRNHHGELVEASLESIGAAAARTEMRDDFKVSITDATGAGAYPIASFTWLVVPARIEDPARRTAMTAFLRWMLGQGQRQAAALGYLALPANIVGKEEAAIARME